MSYVSDGFTPVTPYLIVDGAADAIEYYRNAFGAEERMRLPGPDGSVLHAEILIGGATVMLANANAEWGFKSPKTLGGSPASVFLYVPDVDATIKSAVDAGGSETQPADDMFWGDRLGKIMDPFGHEWTIATHVEDVPPDEMAKRQEAWMKEMSGG